MKRDKYLDFALVLKTLSNMTVIQIVIGVLKTIHLGLVKGLEDLEIRVQVVAIQTIALLKISQNTEKSPGGLRRPYCYPNSSRKPSANADMKYSQLWFKKKKKKNKKKKKKTKYQIWNHLWTFSF